MKRKHIARAATLMVLTAWVGLACDRSAVTEVKDEPDRQLATSGSDLLPDLGMARLSDLSIQTTSDGRRLLRYSTTIVNVGAGPFEARAGRATADDPLEPVFQRIADGSGGWRDMATDADLIFGGDGHNHWHVRDLESAELIRLDNGVKVGTWGKRGFCFFDNRTYRLGLEDAPQSEVYGGSGCGTPTSLEILMGLSVGWGDIYPAWLPDQYIDITGLSPGRYRLVVSADTSNWFLESDESNNVTWVDLQLQGRGKNFRIVRYGPAA